MYTVIVVDDEQTSRDHICTIVDMKCPGFTVIAQADNGQSGLEKVLDLKPDLVISDIKMPIMNGIQMVSEIRKEAPDTLALVVSGYQEFEYAKESIRLGVCDYILKPITPSNMKKVMDDIMKKLVNIHYQKRNHLVKKMTKGIQPERELLDRYFPSQAYYGAIIRTNSLPGRFSDRSELELFSNKNEQVLIYGRDEMEELYIFPEELLFQKSFEEVVRKNVDKEKKEDCFNTAIIFEEPFSVEQLAEKVMKLYQVLDERLVIGHSQFITLDEEEEKHEEREKQHTYALADLEYYLQEKKYQKFENEVKKLILQWKDEKCPQLMVENKVRHIFYILERHGFRPSYDNFDYMIEDLFFYAASMEIVLENILSILNKSVFKLEQKQGKRNDREVFAEIKQYLEEHIRDPLSLQSICREFGLSQPSLSKMFRKYENSSFNHYLTGIRMEKAKALLESEGDIFVKDVAAMVGYPDQFYFSRIFRSIVGMSPTEYLESFS